MIIPYRKEIDLNVVMNERLNFIKEFEDRFEYVHTLMKQSEERQKKYEDAKQAILDGINEWCVYLYRQVNIDFPQDPVQNPYDLFSKYKVTLIIEKID